MHYKWIKVLLWIKVCQTHKKMTQMTEKFQSFNDFILRFYVHYFSSAVNHTFEIPQIPSLGKPGNIRDF